MLQDKFLNNDFISFYDFSPGTMPGMIEGGIVPANNSKISTDIFF